MRNRKNKNKTKITEGKNREWQEGYNEAKEYFDYLIEGGNRTGSAPFRVFIETVAYSIKNKEIIGQDRIDALDCMLKWSDSDFNKGVMIF